MADDIVDADKWGPFPLEFELSHDAPRVPLWKRDELLEWDHSKDGVLHVGWRKDGAGAVYYGHRFTVPSEFLVLYDDPRFPVKVTLDVVMTSDGPSCLEVTAASRENGKPVTLTVLRDIRVKEIETAALDLVAREIDWSPDPDDPKRSQIGITRPVSSTRELDQGLGAAAPVRAPRSMTENHAREILDVYEKGKSTGKPTRALMEHFNWLEGKAHRERRKARTLMAFIDELDKKGTTDDG